MRLITLIFLLLMLDALHGQTVVIAYQDKDAIYVGADSRQRLYNYSGGTWTVDTSQMCKIITVGNKFNMAFVGWNITNSIKTAKLACVGSKTFDDAMEKYINAYVPQLADSFSNKSQAFLQSMMERYPEKLSEVLFFGFESDTALMVSVEFKLTGVDAEAFYLDTATVKKNPYCAGHVQEIEAEVNNLNSWKRGPVLVMNKLIARQARNYPMSVACPVDIIKVTPKGRKWIQRKQLCK